MQRTTQYVGLDVRQATTVASVRSERGQLIARAAVPGEFDFLLNPLHPDFGSIPIGEPVPLPIDSRLSR